MDINKLLDKAKEVCKAKNDSEFARAIGVSRQAVSTWRQGNAYPDAVTCATIAGITGIPLAQVLGWVGEARAISREEKAVWRKLAATAALLALLLLPGLPMTAQAGTGWVQPSPVLCIMRN